MLEYFSNLSLRFSHSAPGSLRSTILLYTFKTFAVTVVCKTLAAGFLLYRVYATAGFLHVYTLYILLRSLSATAGFLVIHASNTLSVNTVKQFD